MRLRNAAIIATTIVIIVGFALISPLFFSQSTEEDKRKVLLIFSVTQQIDAANWCKDLSEVLRSNNLPATVFVVGRVAEETPQTITCFGTKVDVGSLTYSGADLTKISDYLDKLSQVQEGKIAIDNAGHIDSKVFQSPYGATDQDIYSLLSRSGILADFSYNDHYNVYQNGQFIRYNATVLDGKTCTLNPFSKSSTSKPIIVKFDNSSPISTLQSFLSSSSLKDFDFVNSSQLTNISLTNKG